MINDNTAPWIWLAGYAIIVIVSVIWCAARTEREPDIHVRTYNFVPYGVITLAAVFGPFWPFGLFGIPILAILYLAFWLLWKLGQLIGRRT